MIFNRYTRVAAPMADQLCLARGDVSHRERLSQATLKFVAEQLALYRGGEEAPLARLLDVFACSTHAWTIHNCCMVLAQKPDLAVPVTPKTLRYIARMEGRELKVKPNVRPASILVVAERNEAPPELGKPVRAQHQFYLLPCVYDLNKDVEGAEDLVLPEHSPEFSRRVREALIEREAEAVAGSFDSAFSFAADAAVFRELMHKDKVEPLVRNSAEHRFAAARLATFLMLRSVGERASLPHEALESVRSPRSLFDVLGPAVRAVRGVLNPLVRELGLTVSRYAAAAAAPTLPATASEVEGAQASASIFSPEAVRDRLDAVRFGDESEDLDSLDQGAGDDDAAFYEEDEETALGLR